MAENLQINSGSAPTEALLTLKEAASQLGIPVSTLRKAAKLRLIPSYALFNSRKRVKLSEVLAVIDTFKIEGGR